MTSSLLCKSDVDFLLVLAENERYLTYKEIVNFHFEKVSRTHHIENELAEKKKIYANFRKAKSRLQKIQESIGRNYFKEDGKSKTFKIHSEAVEKPKTCIILLEFIIALRTGKREVKRGEFEQAVSTKYKDFGKADEWSEKFVRIRLKEACDSQYVSFDKRKNEYGAKLRLTTDKGLIIGIVKSYCDKDDTNEKMKIKLEELLKVL
jgi:hypothetical protein